MDFASGRHRRQDAAEPARGPQGTQALGESKCIFGFSTASQASLLLFRKPRFLRGQLPLRRQNEAEESARGLERTEVICGSKCTSGRFCKPSRSAGTPVFCGSKWPSKPTSGRGPNPWPSVFYGANCKASLSPASTSQPEASRTTCFHAPNGFPMQRCHSEP